MTETETISDARARVIASEWHGGQGSPLYALSSSGAIVPGVWREIRRDIAHAQNDPRELARLFALLAYVDAHAVAPEPTDDDDDPDRVREPVAGWASLWDDGDVCAVCLRVLDDDDGDVCAQCATEEVWLERGHRD